MERKTCTIEIEKSFETLTETLNYLRRGRKKQVGKVREHFSKNLSESLNIYVDLFQLIDFLSMFLRIVRVLQFDTKKRREKSKRKDLSLLCDVLTIQLVFLLMRVKARKFKDKFKETNVVEYLNRMCVWKLLKSLNGFCFRPIPSTKFLKGFFLPCGFEDFQMACADENKFIGVYVNMSIF